MLKPTFHYLETCTSTNVVAQDLAKRGAANGTVVISKIQTQGKGRIKRTWVTTANSLAFSVILRPEIKIEQAPRLPLITSVAIWQALTELNVETFIKWPNDIVFLSPDQVEVPGLGPYRKAGGVLAEVSMTKNQIDYVIVGIGLNLKRTGKNDELTDLEQAGFLSDAGLNTDKEIILEKILVALFYHFANFNSTEHWNSCLDKLRKFSATLNRNISYQENNETAMAKAIAINNDGSLLIKNSNGTTKNINAGDVSL